MIIFASPLFHQFYVLKLKKLIKYSDSFLVELNLYYLPTDFRITALNWLQRKVIIPVGVFNQSLFNFVFHQLICFTFYLHQPRQFSSALLFAPHPLALIFFRVMADFGRTIACKLILGIPVACFLSFRIGP